LEQQNMTISKGLISVIEVAKETDRHKTVIFRVLKRLGIEAQKLKGPFSHGQHLTYITREEYRLVKAELRSMRRHRRGSKAVSSELAIQESGVFYVVQLEPDHDPGRFKVGFASNLAERLRAHRTSAPFAEVLKTWPCRPLWERTVIDCVCDECDRLHTEVFRTDSIDRVITKCDEFFALMPRLRDSNEISDSIL
jgi:hypothetical protein